MAKYLNTKPGSVEEVVSNMSKNIRQDSAYQDMFKKELEKAGKGIGAMSPKEKKDFFNKIDAKYKAPNEKPEQKEELQVEQTTDSGEDTKQETEETKEETPQKEELEQYSEGVKKRIAKLTRKMREAERQKEEAILYAKSVTDKQKALQDKYENLDTNYVSEFENRVKSNL